MDKSREFRLMICLRLDECLLQLTSGSRHGDGAYSGGNQVVFHSARKRYCPARLSQQGDATMKKLLLVSVAGLALSTSAMGQPYQAPPPPPPACYPVASWTDVNANVCIKYVCAGGGFQIRCLPAPPL